MSWLAETLDSSRREAERRNFPLFLGPERDGTPLNATPYVAHIDEVREGGFLSNREPFVAQLRVALDRLSEIGARPIAALLGGSCIGDAPAPADLDCVVFYECGRKGVMQAGELAKLQYAMKAKRLDLRLVPMDGDPILALKAMSFFSILYSKRANSNILVRGLVLLDLRRKKDELGR